MKLINPGTLPTASAIHDRCIAQGVTSGTALRILRELMKRDRLDDARRLLNALGFDWRPSKADCPKCGATCLCADVEAVMAAGGGE